MDGQGLSPKGISLIFSSLVHAQGGGRQRPSANSSPSSWPQGRSCRSYNPTGVIKRQAHREMCEAQQPLHISCQGICVHVDVSKAPFLGPASYWANRVAELMPAMKGDVLKYSQQWLFLRLTDEIIRKRGEDDRRERSGMRVFAMKERHFQMCQARICQAGRALQQCSTHRKDVRKHCGSAGMTSCGTGRLWR